MSNDQSERVIDEHGELIIHLSDDEATKLAKEVLAEKIHISYVEAAKLLSKVVLGQRARVRVSNVLHQSLKDTQTVCTNLRQESRRLAAELLGARNWVTRFCDAQEQVDILKQGLEECDARLIAADRALVTLRVHCFAVVQAHAAINGDLDREIDALRKHLGDELVT